MGYSGRPRFRWDRMAGFAVFLVTSFVLLSPMLAVFVKGCFWEGGCDTSQALGFVASFFAAFALAAPVGWATSAAVNRLFHIHE